MSEFIDEKRLESWLQDQVDYRFRTLRSDIEASVVRRVTDAMTKVIEGDTVMGEVRAQVPKLVGKELSAFKDSGWFTTWARAAIEGELERNLRNSFKVEVKRMVEGE